MVIFDHFLFAKSIEIIGKQSFVDEISRKKNKFKGVCELKCKANEIEMQLFNKYNLTEDERNHIKSLIKDM